MTRQGRVLYIDLENSAEQAKQLISSLTKFLGIPMVPENLWFWNYNQASPTGNIRDYVLKMIRDLKPDFVIIDSLTAFHPEIEDKNSIAIALLMRGFARVTGEIPACYISRHFDGSGEPVGYSLLAGAKLLRNTDQQDAYRLLPRVFRFKDAQMAYAKGGQATSDFLRKCTSLNILRRANGRYEKVIQQESSAQ